MEQKYILVTCNGYMELEEFEYVAELVAKLKEKRAEELQNPSGDKHVVVVGNLVSITKGDYKQLVFPDKSIIPLVDIPREPQIDPDGRLVDPVMQDPIPTPPTELVEATINHDEDEIEFDDR